jgi:5-formyltetrahydrofolate cyclo-ligase
VDTDTDTAKQRVRERIWALLDEHGAVQPPGAAGHIPSFVGAELAAGRLAALDQWRTARVVKANPDTAQKPVRVLALDAGKVLYMAVPKLAALQPFYLLNADALTVPFAEAATSHGAARFAERVAVADMRPVDFIVTGSVAVDRRGARIGKGAGYADIEIALLTEAGLIDGGTVIATTVHDLQVVNEPLPETAHDFSVDLIATPTQVIHCGPARRPAGIYWDHLTDEKIAAIPALAAQSNPRKGGSRRDG